MSRLRVGIVGVGMAGAYHHECLERVYGVDLEVAGVTSLREKRRAAFGQEHGVPVYDSVRSDAGARGCDRRLLAAIRA